jgi:hypothetical protein
MLYIHLLGATTRGGIHGGSNGSGPSGLGAGGSRTWTRHPGTNARWVKSPQTDPEKERGMTDRIEVRTTLSMYKRLMMPILITRGSLALKVPDPELASPGPKTHRSDPDSNPAGQVRTQDPKTSLVWFGSQL